ncbi:MAG: Glu-tRNA(Gln) amidotransferase subunit GatE [Candidatus Altiarchaeota archaeon]
MSLDYKKLGFKCGIEIHQQLDTHKLFCDCPSAARDDKPDITVERKMRAVAGELGDVDPAALHEFLRNRTLVYEAYRDTTCLVELDEEPPHPLNLGALRTVLEVAFLMEAKPVDELHVMRKTVIDGSNTSGFQRTMLVAVDGVLQTSEGPIGVPTICLEEDAARIISEDGGKVRYHLDRLGIPLIELATSPDIKSPQHAREVAEKIGGILRSSQVKRGLGTIRQDLNVSIAEGQRIEVKGVQDLRLISKVVEGEVERQAMLVEAKKELARRGIRENDYDREPADVTDLFKGTQSAVVRKGLESGGIVHGVILKGLKGLLKGRLGPQLAQYARAMAGVKGIFHGDELPAYGISPAEVDAVMKRLDVSGDDSYLLVAGTTEQAKKALDAVLGRCRSTLAGVPDEVRRAKDDGSTEYMRPLPGSKRMYPETDEPLLPLDSSLLKDVSSHLPELREDKAKRYMELGLGAEMASQISRSKEAGLFEELAGEFPKVEATLIAQTLTATPKEAEKRYKADVAKLTVEHQRQILRLISEGRISKNVVAELMAKVCENPGDQVEKSAEKNRLTTLTDAELKAVIARLKTEDPRLQGAQLMGKVMAETKGRADPKKVGELQNSG